MRTLLSWSSSGLPDSTFEVKTENKEKVEDHSLARPAGLSGGINRMVGKQSSTRSGTVEKHWSLQQRKKKANYGKQQENLEFAPEARPQLRALFPGRVSLQRVKATA